MDANSSVLSRFSSNYRRDLNGRLPMSSPCLPLWRERSFEQIRIGDGTFLPPVRVTQDMVDLHTQLYGSDWTPGAMRDEATASGLVPSPLVLALVAGQLGESNFLGFRVASEANAKFLRPIKVGDIFVCECIVKDTIPPRDSSRDSGQVVVEQNIYTNNVAERPCYTRDMVYIVPRAVGMDLSREGSGSFSA